VQPAAELTACHDVRCHQRCQWCLDNLLNTTVVRSHLKFDASVRLRFRSPQYCVLPSTVPISLIGQFKCATSESGCTAQCAAAGEAKRNTTKLVRTSLVGIAHKLSGISLGFTSFVVFRLASQVYFDSKASEAYPVGAQARTSAKNMRCTNSDQHCCPWPTFSARRTESASIPVGTLCGD
jgi:hypothetical protein